VKDKYEIESCTNIEHG